MADHVHRYRTRLEWAGTTGVGYDHYDRSHRLWAVTDSGPVASGSPGGLQLSGDPAFGGDGGRLNPEQLLLAAASSCHLLSFLAIAARRRLDVVAYTDDASGSMAEADRPVRINRITLRPHVTFRSLGAREVTPDEVDRLHARAHRECYVASTITSEVLV